MPAGYRRRQAAASGTEAEYPEEANGGGKQSASWCQIFAGAKYESKTSPASLLILEALVLLGRLTLAALVLAASASGALGLAAMIGDAFVKLPPPADFCELTPQYEFDGNAFNAMS